LVDLKPEFTELLGVRNSVLALLPQMAAQSSILQENWLLVRTPPLLDGEDGHAPDFVHHFRELLS